MPLGVIVGRAIAVDSKGNIFIAEVEGKVHKFD
jgi:ligand-binding sensor domain-containing protein